MANPNSQTPLTNDDATSDADASAAEFYLNRFPTAADAIATLAQALHTLTGDLETATLINDLADALARREK